MKNIIVLDLDGTLLRDDKTISNETIQTLIKAKKQENEIIFATARPPRSVYQYIPKDLQDSFIICYNGACMVQKNKIIAKKEITRQEAMQILNKAKEFEYNKICFEINDILYSNFDVEYFFGKIPYQKTNLENLNFENAFKIIVCSEKPIKKDFLKELPSFCKGVITDKGNLCQIMNYDVSKWRSIEFLLDKLKFSKENVIAFGDDYNDLEMIQNVGLGIAMENSTDDIKAVAKGITASNNCDGVAKFIKENVIHLRRER